MHHKDNNT